MAYRYSRSKEIKDKVLDHILFGTEPGEKRKRDPNKMIQKDAHRIIRRYLGG